MIPKIIHYCWFGNGELPDKVKYCIESWKRVFPDYEIKLWNESNFDCNISRFTKEAYNERKFAFVSDYVRLYALKKYGGIYLDVDMEFIKSTNDLLENSLFLGFEEPSGGVASCVIGSEKNHPFIIELLDRYNQMRFINEDLSYNMTPNTILIEKLLVEGYGLKPNGQYQKLMAGIHVYPFDYFHPLSLITGKMDRSTNTYSIHHHTLLWVSQKTRLLRFIRLKVLVPLIGKEQYVSLVKKLKFKNS
jgi:hypothetical protein